MTAFALSLIRTIVPIAVGSLLGWLAVLGLNIDQAGAEGLAIFIAGTLTAAYYSAIRWIGQRYPGVEILLGSRQSPDGYSKGNLNHTAVPNVNPPVEEPWLIHPSNGRHEAVSDDDAVPPGYTS